MRDREELVAVDLDDGERRLLDRGLTEWFGPASCTDALAVAMGFASVNDLFEQVDRILPCLREGEQLSRWDWTRVLVATEIVFASDVFGSGVDWESSAGLSDGESVRLLRSVQRKIASARAEFRSWVTDTPS